MKPFNPLSRESINALFITSSKNPNRLIKREDSCIEFKESYNHGSMALYFRTIASFANKGGGYIIFGIGDSPRDTIGLKPKNLKQFEELKPEEFTKNLCDYFSPEIQWTNATYEFSSRQFGVIYIYELQNKPAICKKTYIQKEDKYSLKEGDIYYRYGGRSEKIKYSELNQIIEIQRKKEQAQWMKFIAKVSKIGVENAGILDITTGKIEGRTGSVLIDESLLSQIAFIKEGAFSETSGTPTLKLIGSVETISNERLIYKKEVVKIKGIREVDIIENSLLKKNVEDPEDYITQICHSATAFLPVYYYMSLASLDSDAAVALIETVNVRTRAKSKLIERISQNKREYSTMQSGLTRSTKRKRDYIKMFIDGNVPGELEKKELLYCIQSIKYLTNEEITEHREYISIKVLSFYRKYYASANQSLAESFKRVFCRIDEALYAP